MQQSCKQHQSYSQEDTLIKIPKKKRLKNPGANSITTKKMLPNGSVQQRLHRASSGRDEALAVSGSYFSKPEYFL